MENEQEDKSYKDNLLGVISDFPTVTNVYSLPQVFNTFYDNVKNYFPPESEADIIVLNDVMFSHLAKIVKDEYGISLSDDYISTNSPENYLKMMDERIIRLLQSRDDFMMFSVVDYISKEGKHTTVDSVREAITFLQNSEWNIDAFVEHCEELMKIDDDPVPPYLFLLEIPAGSELPIVTEPLFYTFMLCKDEDNINEVIYDAIRLAQDI